MSKISNFINEIKKLAEEHNMSEESKTHLFKQIQKLSESKVNILITGATGCGKSSTINALFGEHIAKVGQTPDPETMTIDKFELNENMTLWDSPGLGDGKESDVKHAKAIHNLLTKKDPHSKDDAALIDLVVVILDGSSRDLGTSYQLINTVIIPALGKNTDRLLVAINQCDVAMKGRYWNHETNQPEPELVKFLEEKVESTRRRIFEATQVKVEPIYYSAGFKDGEQEQRPYNLSKLLCFMVENTPSKKRLVLVDNVKEGDKGTDDGKNKYGEVIEKSLWGSIGDAVSDIVGVGAHVVKEIGGFVANVGKSIVEKAVSFVSKIFSWW